LTFVAKSEAEGVRGLHDRIALGSTIHADEASHWDAFHARYVTKRVNHSEAYSHDGACTNQAESFFSRLRRAEIGTHHKIAGPYLAAYAAEMDWREDNRRISNGEQYAMIVRVTLMHPVSMNWKGYWQRKVKDERATHVLTGLMTKRAELAGMLEHHQAKVRQLMIDLDAIDQALRLFKPDIELADIKAKPMPPRHAAYKGRSRASFSARCEMRSALVLPRN
jgi:hypothetical protein